MLFIIVFVMLNSLFSAVYFFSVADALKVEKEHAEFFAKYNDQKRIILGNSMPKTAIAADKLPSTISFCFDGETVIETYYKLEFLLNKGMTFDQIIIPCMPEYFVRKKVDSQSNYSYWKKLVNYDELGDLSNGAYEYKKYQIKSMLFPYKNYAVGKLNEWFSKGQKGNNLSELTPSEQKKSAQIIYSFIAKNHYLNDEVALAYFEKIQALCYETNMQLITIELPVSKFFLELREQNIDYYFQERINKLTAKHIELDYSGIFVGNPEYFKDANHLNENGKKVLTEILLNDLKTTITSQKIGL